MVGRRVLHGDLSPNNAIIYQGKGYFIDFDHAKFLNDDGKADPSPHGTVSYNVALISACVNLMVYRELYPTYLFAFSA